MLKIMWKLRPGEEKEIEMIDEEGKITKAGAALMALDVATDVMLFAGIYAFAKWLKER